MVNLDIIRMASHRGVIFQIRNNLLDPLSQWLKWGMDLLASAALTLLLFPLLAFIALAIYLQDGKSPVYRQERMGRRGRSFRIYKFRTMRQDADELLEKLLDENSGAREEWERERKLREDPRVTKIGSFLRRSSLDELPQLLNVLRGEMSLVGPRPITESEGAKYGERLRYYTAVKPGITGLWQVSGRNDLSYPERVALDVWYVRNWSIDLDLMILYKTIDTVLSGRGSY